MCVCIYIYIYAVHSNAKKNVTARVHARAHISHSGAVPHPCWIHVLLEDASRQTIQNPGQRIHEALNHLEAVPWWTVHLDGSLWEKVPEKSQGKDRKMDF